MHKRNKLNGLTLFTFAVLFTVSCGTSPVIKGIFVDFDKIGRVKDEIRKGNPKIMPPYKSLIEKAEKAMNEGPFSVMDKKQVPPSGDKHDYLSMGPYWWPDSSKANGLPYIRKDGQTNPETRGDNVDQPAKSKFFSNVESLAWAFYFTGENKYAGKAVELLKVWFIDPATRMNPSLNYAQGIPGICEGRGIGIIDWSRIDMLISPIQILVAYGFLDPEMKSGLFNWFGDYLNWLLTSKYGKDEDDASNNHGTWFDVEVVGTALLLGKNELAKERLEIVKTKRIQSQVEPDGSQPKELARTKALSYSAMNLTGLSYLANLGQVAGVDLWTFETPDGRSIKKAYQYLQPIATGEKQWNFPQIVDPEGSVENLKPMFRMAASRTSDSVFSRVAKMGEVKSADLKMLLYPLPD